MPMSRGEYRKTVRQEETAARTSRGIKATRKQDPSGHSQHTHVSDMTFAQARDAGMPFMDDPAIQSSGTVHMDHDRETGHPTLVGHMDIGGSGPPRFTPKKDIMARQTREERT